MKIDDDIDVFKFARLLSILEKNNEGTAFLCNYWKKCGKLDKLLLIIKNQDFNLKFEGIQYLIAAENCCEQLYQELDNFLRVPYCSEEMVECVVDSETIANANNLIKNLKKINSLYVRNSWEDFFGQLSELSSRIISSINRIVGSGKNFHFCTNIKANQILSGVVNYDNSSDNYFIFRYRMQ